MLKNPKQVKRPSKYKEDSKVTPNPKAKGKAKAKSSSQNQVIMDAPATPTGQQNTIQSMVEDLSMQAIPDQSNQGDIVFCCCA